MRIDKIELQNFCGFEHFEMKLHPQFTLLVGENGSGKTSVLSGLAVALGVWARYVHADGRKVEESEIRYEAVSFGERLEFKNCFPVTITAQGVFSEVSHLWSRVLSERGGRTQEEMPKPLMEQIEALAASIESLKGIAPIVVHYGPRRSTPRENAVGLESVLQRKPSRLDGYTNFLNADKQFAKLYEWFFLESAHRDSEGRFRPGFETVRIALQQCIPGVEKVWFDHDFLELAVRIDGQDRLFSTLSDGQIGMAAMVADMAIRAVTLNSHLLPAKLEKGKEDAARRVLDETPGVVLIDELDLHLHPKWQRSVAADLMRTFPKVQFVATSHSPQIIGELEPEMVMLLEDNQAYPAPRSIGLDSNRVLEELMGAEVRNKGIAEKISEIARLIDDEELDEAKRKIEELAKTVGEDDPEITHANTMIHFLEGEAVHEND